MANNSSLAVFNLDQVSKLGKMQCPNSEAVTRDVKADDLRQMFLAMTEEVRAGYSKITRCHTFLVIALNLAQVLATLGMGNTSKIW